MRPPWESLPTPVTAWVGAALGSPVVAAQSESGGFSPGVAARVRCASGRRAFVKAASGEVNPGTLDLHRREAVVTAALPPAAGAPALLGVLDDDPWVVLVLEEVDGRPPVLPWRPDELAACVAALDRLHDALTPSPLALEPAAVLQPLTGWRQLADEGTALTPWEDRHLDRLVASRRSGPRPGPATPCCTWTCGPTTCWSAPTAAPCSWTGRTPPSATPSATCCSPRPRSSATAGPPPPRSWPCRGTAGRSSPSGSAVLVAAFAGLMQHRRRQPPPPGMPTVRGFQAAQGDVALRWLDGLPS